MKIETRTRKLIWSYTPDWLLTIVLAALFLSLDKVDGYRREFSLSDTSLRHSYAVHERVPNFALYLICVIAPIVLQPTINLLTVRSWWDFHNSTLGLVLGLAITGSITQFVKITVGRPRPDIIDRCQPPRGSVDPVFGLSTWQICTQTESFLLRDGFRSFPSGHSSLSFAGLGFLAYYLAGKLHLFDKRGHTGKAWISLAPFAAAALVAISRTMDYRHHWQDVLIGSLLGTAMSYFAYRQYYPPLSSEMSHKPYSPRIKREMEAILPVYHHERTESSSQDIQQGRPTMVRRYEPEAYELTGALDAVTKAPQAGWGRSEEEGGLGNEYTKPAPAGTSGLA
ncbi:PAP2-domain-containing protein [Marasmius fiardii PR-910]|nr:PAP2-domain-containing protein [Marasmius fiardii PR-910]